MVWSLEAAKTRLGIEPDDLSKDVQIQTALDVALNVAEKYCNRFFLQRSETVKFYHTATRVFQFKRYPILEVSKGAENAKVHHTSGHVEFAHAIVREEMEFEYVGGYAVLPPDLEMALWMIFDNAYRELEPNASKGLSDGLKKLQITGVGSVDYGTSGSSSDGTGTSALVGGMIPLTATGILDLYRLPGA